MALHPFDTSYHIDCSTTISLPAMYVHLLTYASKGLSNIYRISIAEIASRTNISVPNDSQDHLQEVH